MNCMNCGARLDRRDRLYCPSCGFNITIQRKVEYISKYYYNQGLEKATIRDLSGAISCLRQSLAYDKNNIDARNLLGLVYFETGEVVAGLSEWVISKNLQPRQNLASTYIEKLQANPNRLEAINETIKKYNHSLILCREGHTDMAEIQLKRILQQNSKLIKGYHLLALLQMKKQDWNRARKTLRKAARIDKTNTTTLRFLKEVDEQTGVTTRLERSRKGIFGSGSNAEPDDPTDLSHVVQTQPSKAKRRVTLFFTLMLGTVIGASALWLLGIPAIRQGIYREANDQIVKYSESLASQGAELSRAQGQVEESDNAAEAVRMQIDIEQKKNTSYEHLLEAYMALVQADKEKATEHIEQVYESVLTEEQMQIYSQICMWTETTGITAEQEKEAQTQAMEEIYGDHDGD